MMRSYARLEGRGEKEKTMTFEMHTTRTFTLELDEPEINTIRHALVSYRDSLTPEDDCGHSVTADINDILRCIGAEKRSRELT
jgi:hypothetical protein